MDKLTNTRIGEKSALPTAKETKGQYPLYDAEAQTVVKSRRAIERILRGDDMYRLLAVVGPCSIHNTEEMYRYAKRLAPWAHRLKDQLVIVLRFCGDKPRTGKGWPGFWSDPDMDGSYDFARGWTESRRLARRILELGLPLGCEFLDATHYQHIDDMISYAWIGARDVGSGWVRRRASGLSAPVGFKNHNSGGVEVALNAIAVAREKNFFTDADEYGKPCRFGTLGNKLAHLIHRGTSEGPNYDVSSIADSARKLADRGFLQRIVVDASHDNSGKDYRKQGEVIDNLVEQVEVPGSPVAGVMYESFLQPGRQDIPEDLSTLQPGLSVTDGCEGWERTEEVLRGAHRRLAQRNGKSKKK